ncbi:alpha/beta fold hydrolase [Pseudoprimorskyibacter insulae]|uniref:3-oxoadipate enol-lactonase 2 n=1 Tax=Pseudoprimorskyibacter insulae TaxID=1695997 RepID=A0A2R8AUY3_9RHOB|nr:alpha/beta hydrolase [Pseudoprimorskyibacter insulae]SPF79858.1 3-oxoadipate enol-lactonase 2 [Pseudoprimorskyibacter insulae]
MSPRFAFVPVMDHEIHVTLWGDAGKPALVMWHGLARTGRDFDEIAAALSDSYFVICPDTIGRGLSSWSQDPEAEYSIEYLSGIAVDLLDHFGVDKAAWLGTSMGGLVGMRMASGPLAERLRCLIINDIGPEIPQEAIDRILTYAGNLPVFDQMSEAEQWLRQVYAPFGPADEAFWTRMVRTSIRRKDDGRLTLHYDPQIITLFSASAHELHTWDRWDRITLPTHLIQGKTSDILPDATALRMTQTGPRPALSVFDDCGHAPTMSRPSDIALVRGILDRLLSI